MLKENTPVRKPWNNELLLANELRPEVKKAREDLYQDMYERWISHLSLERKRFYMIATICDPRQKALRFPGISGNDRESGHEWFEAEYLSLWAANDPACKPQSPDNGKEPATGWKQCLCIARQLITPERVIPGLHERPGTRGRRC
ncbi:hypothetical protein AB1Y20_004030 [Prymnesium parvum]|uniref:Uncharacterized protein n=1 Tax=Prymnesium parvum TaxID=97485 RepID=A0AB34J6D8_PRYPA